MTAEPDAGVTPRISEADIAEMHELADVLAAIDEAEDIALDLYERPLGPKVGKRAVEFFQSERWQYASTKQRDLARNPQDSV